MIENILAGMICLFLVVAYVVSKFPLLTVQYRQRFVRETVVFVLLEAAAGVGFLVAALAGLRYAIGPAILLMPLPALLILVGYFDNGRRMIALRKKWFEQKRREEQEALRRASQAQPQ